MPTWKMPSELTAGTRPRTTPLSVPLSGTIARNADVTIAHLITGRSTTAPSLPRTGTASVAPRTPSPLPKDPSSAPPSTKRTWISSWMASVLGTRTQTTPPGSAEHSLTASSRTTTPSDPAATGQVLPEPPGCAHEGATRPGEMTTSRWKIPQGTSRTKTGPSTSYTAAPASHHAGASSSGMIVKSTWCSNAQLNPSGGRRRR